MSRLAEHWRMGLGLDDLEAQHGLPQGLLTEVLRVESAGNPGATSRAGAQGLFQFMPRTARGYGIDPYDPAQAAPAAAKELGSLYQKYQGDVSKTLAAYNWGQDRVDRLGLAKAPQETRGYISTILGALSPRSAEAGPREAHAQWGAPSGPTPWAPRLQRHWDMLTPVPAPPPRPGAEPLPQVVPHPDPTQPATLQAPGQGMPLPQAAPQPGMPTQGTIAPPPRMPPNLGEDLRRSLGGAAAQDLPPATRQFDPATMDDTAILQKLGMDPGVIMQSQFYQPGMLQRALTTPGSWGETLMQSGLGSLLQGARRPLDAGAQLATRGLATVGLLSPADVALTDAMVKLKQAEYEQTPRPTVNVPGLGAMQPAELVGSLAVPLPGAKGVTPVQSSSGVVANTLRGMSNAVTSGAVAGLAQPVMTPGTPGTPDDTFLQQKAQQAATGALVGGITGAVTAPPMAVVNKMVNARRLGTMTENAMQETTHLRQAMAATPYTAMAEIDAAAAKGDRIAVNLKQAIVDAGDDWQKIAQTSGGVALFKKRLQAEELYDEVARLAQGSGNVPVTKTLQTIDNAIAKLEQEALPDTATIATLKAMKADLSPTTQTGTTPPAARTPYTPATTQLQPTTSTVQVPADTSYARLRDLRSKMGDLITSYYRPQGQGLVAQNTIGKEGITVVPQIQQALEQDLLLFARRSGKPDLAKAAHDADRFYTTEVAPYHDRLLAKAFKNDFSDEVYHQFIKQGRGERAQYYYDALDPKGRAAVRYKMLTEGIDQAVDPVSGRLDTAKFTEYMHNRQEAHGVFFTGQDKRELDGVTRLLQHDALYAQWGKRIPAIGSSVLPGAGYVISGAVGGVVGGTLAVTLGTAKLLLSTERGRRFLLSASTLEPGSGAFQARLDAVLQQLPRATATEQTAPSVP